MSGLIVPLVGSHFYPPAKVLIGVMNLGTKVTLVPEDTNPYDAKAIKVMVDIRDITVEMGTDFESLLEGSGVSVQDLLDQPIWQLGHIGDSDGRICQKKDWKGNREVREHFVDFDAPWPGAFSAMEDGSWGVEV